jgi:kumamolisin
MKPLMVLSLLLIAVTSSAHAKPVDLVLRLKERVSMEQLAHNVMDPTSPRYNQFYTPAEIRALVAPTDRDYASLVASLEAKGMHVIRESNSHLIVTVRTDSAQVESTFATKLAVSGDQFAGTTSKVSVPNELSLVESVTGLDQTRKLRSHIKIAGMVGKKSISQGDIKKGYGFNPLYTAGLTGKGQDIAIATYDGFHLSDVAGFFVQSHISPAPKVDVISFNGTAAIKEDSAAETELDAEFSGMIAPGAAIHVFTSADNSDAGELAMFTAILDDNRAKVVNYSWGTCEKQTVASHQTDMDKVYTRALAQGVNIMVASGDSGADGCRDGSKDADWPASSPQVVAVGGTTFSLSSTGKLSEKGWTGSGGGISNFYDLPTYQANFQTPYVKRSFPDVAFNADQNSGEQIWTQYGSSSGTPAWMTVGGTSMAAPQWSGFMALVGEARTKAGKGTLGFLNPILYNLSTAEQAKVLHDVTKGNNGFAAGIGWDAVTGLGSMQADKLLDLLTNQ